MEWPIPDTLSNSDIERLFYPGRGNNEGRKLPNYEYIYNELAKPGVTLSLLWAEYCAQCEAEHTIPYQHTQFNDKYHAYAASKKATLRIKRKPGETMEVDWVGDTLKVHDAASGCDIPAYVFVAVLPCSLYGYAEAFPDMKSNHWIEAHVHAYSFFGGVRVYEDHFEWILNLKIGAGGELDNIGSPIFFKTIMVTQDEERAWFKAHPQWHTFLLSLAFGYFSWKIISFTSENG